MSAGGSNRKRWQITTYLTKDEENDFRDYASALGIDASSLLVLLIQRAGRVGLDDQLIHEVADRTLSGPEKITAHFVARAVFERAVSILMGLPGDLNQSRLCRVLIRLELEQRWLGGELGVDST